MCVYETKGLDGIFYEQRIFNRNFGNIYDECVSAFAVKAISELVVEQVLVTEGLCRLLTCIVIIEIVKAVRGPSLLNVLICELIWVVYKQHAALCDSEG